MGAYVITAALALGVALAMLLPFGTHGEAWAPSQTAGTGSDYLQEGVIAGSPDKFDRDFYRTVLELAGHQVPGQTGPGDVLYRDVVIVVNKYDVDGRNVSGANKDAVAGMLMSAGAQNVAVSETLSLVTASVPAMEILGISGHAAVYRIGDGESQATPIIDAARVTVRATDDDLRRPGGVIADGSGVTVGVVDSGVNHPDGINDKVVDRVVCGSLTCRPGLAEDVHGPDAARTRTNHGTQVALIIAGSGFSGNNGIAPGVDILDAGSGQRLGHTHTIQVYLGFSWLLRSGADVANLSMSGGSCRDTTDTSQLIAGDAVNNGMVVVVGSGNDGASGTGQQQVPLYNSVKGWACTPNVITVGGIDNRDPDNTEMYHESSRGPGLHLVNGTLYPVLKPEIVAPAYYNLPIFKANGITGLVYGTSYSAPAATATAALVLQARDMEPVAVKAALLLGANWTGPVPCTSVQYEQDNATDSCSHERQPSSFEEANRDGSLEIINNVGFGILDTARTLDYVTLESGRHIVEANLGSDADTDVYRFEITDTADPVKVILSWTTDPFFEDYHAPRGENYFADLGFTVDCPGMDTISAQSDYQSNEFAVFMPAQTGTCTVTVSGSGIDTPRRSEQKYALASTFPLIPPGILGAEPAISADGQSPTNSQNVTFAVDFGKAVDPLTFDSSDILISSGNASEPFTADNQIFTFTVGSPDDGTLVVSIPARAVLYEDDNTNPASGTASVDIDTVSPTVASIMRTDPSERITSSETLTFGVAFDEPVTGVNPEIFALSLDAIGYHGWFAHARTVPIPIPDAGTIVYTTSTITDAKRISGYHYSDDGKLTLTFGEAADPGLISEYYYPADERVISDTITVTDPGQIASVSVDVNIAHTHIGDLVVDLVAPDGTVMNLHNMTGFHADDIVRTYTPDFNGTAVAGDWKLRISDNLMFDTGTLNGWTLTIAYSDAVKAVTGLNGSGAQYPVTVRAAINGTYNLDIVPDNGITDIAGNLLGGTDPTGEDQSYIVNTSFVLNASSNNPPLTDAGYDLTVHEGQRVALSGTAVDVEGDPMTYMWSHDSAALAIGLDNPVLPSTAFRAPWVDSDSVLTFTLTADDGTGTTSDSMNVNILDTSGPLRDRHDIGRISLGNTDSGTVQASWEAPEKTPVSYRISWTKVGESYLTWTDSAGNAYPTVPSHTITGLEEDSQYKVKVRASYDGSSGGWSGEQTVTVAGPPVPPNIPATGLPFITGTVEVGHTLTADASGIADADGMTNSTLSYQWISGDGTDDAEIANATTSTHVLAAGDLNSTIKVTVTFTDDAGHAESLTSAATQAVAPIPVVPNTPATGLPVITGTAEVGQTLAADASGIADADGMTNATLSYQWISGDGTDDAEIANATTSSHVLTADHLNSTIKVTVTFTDDAGHQESLTSAATQTVVPAPTVPGSPISLGVLPNGSGTLDVSWQPPASDGGSNLTGYTVQWKAASDAWTAPSDVTEDTVAGTTHTITGLTDGTSYTVRVIATNDVGDGAPSAEETTTPQAPAPPRGPREIGGIVLNSTIPGVIDISWDAPGETPANYRVSWAKVGESYLTWKNLTGNAFPTVPSHTLTGLEDGRQYKIKVRASYDGTAGDWSDEVTATTAAGTVIVPNTPATGLPVITGTAEVGQTLAADVSGIADADGMTNSTLSYQWISGDGTDDADIANATTSSHVLTADHLNSTIKVTVAFTDDAGHAESLTSAATQAVAPIPVVPNTPATGLPVITGTAEVGQTLAADASGIADADGMTNATLSYQWISGDGTDDAEIANATTSTHVLAAGDLNSTIKVTVAFTDDAGHQESLTSAATQAVVPAPTVPGSPISLGVLPNGSGTLDVSWQPPASDGGSNLTGYTVQWKAASDAWTAPSDVTEDTVAGTTHTITGLTDGTSYTVRVIATNDVGDGAPSAEETATPQAPAPPRGPREIGGIVMNSTIPGVIDISWDAPGETPINYRVMWAKVGESYLTWTDLTGNAFPTVSSHTLTGLEDDRQYKIKVRASYDGTAGDWSDEVTATTAAGTVIVPNTPATGLPVITGTAEVGQTLRTDISGIADADGMTNSTLSYQWISGDGTDDAEIANATTSSHVLTADHLNSTIKVTVAFTDDAGHQESLTSAATQRVAPIPVVPNTPATGLPVITGTAEVGQTLRTDISGIADADGMTNSALSYQWISGDGTDDAEIANATASSHVLTADHLNSTIKVTVAFTDDAGHQESLTSAATQRVAPIPVVPNTPATGLPVITGTAEVGQTLRTDISGIADADGMTNSALSYQWISGDGTDDAEIANATASSHVLTADHLNSTIKVTVAFTDDAGHQESLTSAATQRVAPIPVVPNTPATGLPVITGTAEVGQTLRTDISGIADADGMTNSALSYQWISGDGTDDAEIANATASSHVLTADHLNSTIKVTVAFTDDAGHQESLTSAATLAVAPAPATTVVDASSQFITTWQTTLAGESITIPVGGATGIYTVDWGDGNADHDVSGDWRHAYDDAGTYTVRISGDFTRIHLNGEQPNAGKLQSIEQWGDVRWESMESAFQGASSMVYRADDAPDLSDVASMRHMFEDATSFDGDLSAWDVSSVTDMAELFHNADSFNTDLSAWDVSSVAIMRGMFMGTDSFNTDLSAWDVSSVTDMTRMFDHASRFSGDLSAWDVSGVTTMDYMFHDAFAFNGNISAWDVSGVTDMRAMFRNAFYFNSDLSMWDVSGVTDMRAMFRGAVEFNDNISAWNVSGVTKMRNMFSGADAFDQNLGKWYIVLDDTVIEGGNTAGAIGMIAAQNSFLDGQNPTYRIGSGADSEHFEIDGTALKLKKAAQNNLASGSYTVTITSTGEFGTGNSRTYEITVADT